MVFTMKSCSNRKSAHACANVDFPARAAGDENAAALLDDAVLEGPAVLIVL